MYIYTPVRPRGDVLLICSMSSLGHGEACACLHTTMRGMQRWAHAWAHAWMMRWSPERSSASRVLLMAAMPEAVTTAASVPSSNAIFLASSCMRAPSQTMGCVSTASRLVQVTALNENSPFISEQRVYIVADSIRMYVKHYGRHYVMNVRRGWGCPRDAYKRHSHLCIHHGPHK